MRMRRTMPPSLQRPRGTGASRAKGSFFVFLSVSMPALATIALMFVILSVAPTDRDPSIKAISRINLGTPIDRVVRGLDRKEMPSLTANATITAKDVEYHVIFSTGCSVSQDWQSYVFFYYAKVKEQPGTVTRIASGCNTRDKDALQRLFDEQIATMVEPGRFRMHFTPDYSRLKPRVVYKYWNKPFGTKDWMENVLGFPNNPINEDAIVILMDPDQLILRPFRNNDFSNTFWASNIPNPRTRVDHGKPMGQKYGFGQQWRQKIDMKTILPESEATAIDAMSGYEAREGYGIGPPYIATARDMYAIVTKWTEFAIPVHDQYPHLLAEMFAYCLAAAYLRLSHQTAASFMVSEVKAAARIEGWQYIDKLDRSDLCRTDLNPDRLPNVLHFCQRYGVGYWFFGKYKTPKQFLTCEHGLFREPPAHFLEEAEGKVFWPSGGFSLSDPKLAKRNAFMMCHMLLSLNEAAEYFKKRHCPESTANLSKTLTFFPDDAYQRVD